jgi:hypothetical protein
MTSKNRHLKIVPPAQAKKVVAGRVVDIARDHILIQEDGKAEPTRVALPRR